MLIRFLQRALAAVLVAAVIAGAVATAAQPAQALAQDPEDFVLEVFPHKTEDIDFDDDWSERRPGGRRHRGTDVKSPKGTPVLAVADGVVVEMKWHRAGGWSVHLRHADGWSTKYLHLNDDTPGTNDGKGGEATAFAPGLAAGDFVLTGQVIGFVGNSGNAEVPHTHFEIHHGDQKVNPFPYLVDALDRLVVVDRLGGFLP
jgi:murein DD-endopeptidase MepM/ murein hydrolase activator NlpD